MFCLLLSATNQLSGRTAVVWMFSDYVYLLNVKPQWRDTRVTIDYSAVVV